MPYTAVAGGGRPVSQPALAEALAEAAALAYPSTYPETSCIAAIEAMAMGAFPIQTNTSCCEEWFVDGTTGFAVPPDDFETICDRFTTVLADDNLVDSAAEANLEIIRSRLTPEVLRPQMQDFYRRALADAGVGTHARLNIFPDGGVARLRLFGKLSPA